MFPNNIVILVATCDIKGKINQLNTTRKHWNRLHPVLEQINKILKVLNYSFEHGIKLKFRKSIHSIESMALQGLRRQRNSTKKNRRPIFRVIATYRLFNSVANPKHSKNLYRRQSETILRNAEIIFVGELRQESGFSHQICAPCERRLKYAIQWTICIIDWILI
jgi:hypothetical protein